MTSKSLVNCFVWNHQYFAKFAIKQTFCGGGGGDGGNCNRFTCTCMYIAPSSACSLPTHNMPFKVILRRFDVVYDVKRENTALSNIEWWKFISNPPISYYNGFKCFLSELRSSKVRDLFGETPGTYNIYIYHPTIMLTERKRKLFFRVWCLHGMISHQKTITEMECLGKNNWVTHNGNLLKTNYHFKGMTCTRNTVQWILKKRGHSTLICKAKFIVHFYAFAEASYVWFEMKCDEILSVFNRHWQ